jgi:acyl-coenzyme A synthetase/AMP-(fatty) acid ligase
MNHRIVPVLLNEHMDEALLGHLLEVYQPEYIWMPAEKHARFAEMKVIAEAEDYILVKTEYPVVYPLYEELGLLLTTSGSTGSPKFVRQSYANVRNNAEAIAQYLELDETERPITTLPMNYTYGLSIINSHLLTGAAILVTEKSFLQKEFWNFFREQGATSFGGVPYTYEILSRMRFERMNLPSLRTMTQAGGKLLPELHEKFALYAKENNKHFIVMYGQCEATARMGYLPAEMALAKKGSMGVPIPGGKFRLIDAQGNEIHDPYVSGELVYEGKNVTLGYAECGEDLIKADERQGVLHTGDMAQFDEDGYYYIVGRLKRFLKIYGNRVNLDEMDRLIHSAFRIECASTGVDDHLYIFITEAEKAEEVRKFAIQKTGLNQKAFQVKVLDEIPKNDSGKTLYKELKQYIEVK